MGWFSADMQTMKDLFLHSMHDIYYAEHRIDACSLIGRVGAPCQSGSCTLFDLSPMPPSLLPRRFPRLFFWEANTQETIVYQA
jgi:hypothetical protein